MACAITDAVYVSQVEFSYTPNGGSTLSAAANLVEGMASITLSNLLPATTYSVYAKAVATNGSTPQSPQAQFTTQQQTTPPAFANKSWAELPGRIDSDDYIYHAHSQLPSNESLRNFSFCLDKTKYASLWVAYPLHNCYKGAASRTNEFGYDPKVTETAQANIGSYSYYTNNTQSHSRGHQLPSEDRDASTDDNRTTFYATNMTPQLQTLNGGQWASLENKVRGWICTDTLYVVTGAYFDPSRTPTYAQDNRGNGKNCEIPTHYYKVILRTKAGNTGKPVSACSASELQCIGFWFDHAAASWEVAKNARSVEQIETLVGLKFFVNVPNAPKNSLAPSAWGI